MINFAIIMRKIKGNPLVESSNLVSVKKHKHKMLIIIITEMICKISRNHFRLANKLEKFSNLTPYQDLLM